ncbi:hypothetical protein HFO87_09315 [Rhizobium leguminosarum]|uniref:nucleoside 2-deoxyribosyltransferase n=1 Tax=Rhizobium leguminosarum TaxID=384 RepID=UPI001C964E3A|nr:nucleoside 2-deoxyribosyltransferase [Rhizobium leguminosarum]MBY5484670.1 hypothetical protein [Rhizobium leguminosarum]
MDDLARFLSSAMLQTLVTTLPIVVIVYVLIRRLIRDFIKGQQRSRYDDAKHEAVLSELRASYEHRIADLNREMVATRDRWEDANHLIITGQRNQRLTPSNNAVDVEGFLKPYGLDPKQIEVDADKIFVLTPFSSDERGVYEAIKSVCTAAGFVVVRGDERRADGDILPQIIEGIISSRIVIANISSRNPNVFFELGIAMALGKPTLLLSDTLSEVPFDVQSRRIIVFKSTDELRERLTTALLQTVRKV